jgi:hypothetical protein
LLFFRVLFNFKAIYNFLEQRFDEKENFDLLEYSPKSQHALSSICWEILISSFQEVIPKEQISTLIFVIWLSFVRKITQNLLNQEWNQPFWRKILWIHQNYQAVRKDTRKRTIEFKSIIFQLQIWYNYWNYLIYGHSPVGSNACGPPVFQILQPYQISSQYL